MINMKIKDKSLVLINKRTNLNFSNFTMPLAIFTKYPLFLKALFNRIDLIRTQYSIEIKVRVFKLNKDKANAQKELKNKGGVYILWCKKNGLFYVGSALRFFTNKGRLNDYFMKGRVKSSLEGNNTKVSKKLAESIEKYSINSFTLIIVEEYPSRAKELTKKIIQLREQLWMLLYPTLNSSLLVSSNEGRPMTEEKRLKLSTINKFYLYEIKDGVILSGSEKLIFGMKELSRTGILSSDQKIYPIEYNSIKGHLASAFVLIFSPIRIKTPGAPQEGLPWKNKFLLSFKKLQEGYKLTDNKINNCKSRSSGVWVYDYKTHKFISYEPSVKSCIVKYNVSLTHFRRIRKFGLEFKGKLFSNHKLI